MNRLCTPYVALVETTYMSALCNIIMVNKSWTVFCAPRAVLIRIQTMQKTRKLTTQLVLNVIVACVRAPAYGRVRSLRGNYKTQSIFQLSRHWMWKRLALNRSHIHFFLLARSLKMQPTFILYLYPPFRLNKTHCIFPSVLLTPITGCTVNADHWFRRYPP